MDADEAAFDDAVYECGDVESVDDEVILDDEEGVV
jgi:hypothetical protein